MKLSWTEETETARHVAFANWTMAAGAVPGAAIPGTAIRTPRY
jgi:hypothetical protein